MCPRRHLRWSLPLRGDRLKTDVGIEGCTGISKYLNDRSLCPRWKLCPGCEKTRAKRNQWKIAKNLQYDLDLAEEMDQQLKVGILTSTLPGKGSIVRQASLGEQFAYLTKRTTMSGYTGWHSMRGLNTKLKEWGISGGSHFIEFTNKTGQQWNTHLHSVLVGFDEDWKVPLKDTVQYSEWNDDLTMKLQSEKLEQKPRSNKRILEPLGLGRLYTLDIASADEMASIARYSAKVEYVSKPVKVPDGKLPEVSGFLAGGWEHGKERGGHGRHIPRLARPFGDWMKNGAERRFVV